MRPRFDGERLSYGLRQNLSKVFRAVAAGLDDTELPVRVHAALTLTEMVSSHDSVKAAVSPQVGKVIQGLVRIHYTCWRENLSSRRPAEAFR